ncbi:hypothetical protein [Streptomyces sp. NPDC089919]|uniref:hypothetical protein n=1 Tax=Streptomyces sp. NPDC089919 TaxID=3155188 RepID=UPI00343B1CDF
MDTVFASLVAVAGTLIGSFSTYAFQRRTTARTEALAKAERLRQERLTAYSSYAAAVTELKRGMITLWFRRRHTPPDEERLVTALLESDRLGAAADTAAFRLQLVADDPHLRPLMTAISQKLGEITHAADRAALVTIERAFEDRVRAFVDAAGERLR